MIKVHLMTLLEQRQQDVDDLVDALDMPRGTLRKLCDNSAHQIDFDVLEGLCDYLNCSVGELLSHEG